MRRDSAYAYHGYLKRGICSGCALGGPPWTYEIPSNRSTDYENTYQKQREVEKKRARKN